ncbi:MAG: hypothetical protein ACRDF6_07905 [bacterium]
MKRLFALAVFVSLLSMPAIEAQAHPGHSVPLDELIRGAGVIFEGRVAEVRSEWNTDRTQIHTTVAIRVSDYLKGGAGAQEIRLRMLGGTVGEITQAIMGQPAFTRDEQVLLFLSPDWEQGRFPVVFGEHGKFVTTRDPRSGRELVKRPGQNLFKTDLSALIRRMNAGQSE